MPRAAADVIAAAGYDFTAVNETSLAVPSFRVSGVACAAGHHAESAAAVSVQLATTGVLVSPMQITGGHIQEASGTGNCVNMTHWHASCGKAAYTLSAATDTTVAVFFEIRTPITSDDSFFIWMDGGAPEQWHAPQRAVFTWEAAPRNFTLAAGYHTLYIGLREDGAQLRALRVAAGDAAFQAECPAATACAADGEAYTVRSSYRGISACAPQPKEMICT